MDFSGNSSENLTASWHPEPTTRGSFTILSSCIITLILCVWKVVHLNIPEHESCLPERKKTDLRYWMTRLAIPQNWRKIGWLILGMLAPELVTFTAWSQMKVARNLNVMMAEKLLETQSPADDDIEMAPKNLPWTTTHGFYAAMGGYAIDTSVLSPNQKFLPGTRERLTLTWNGLNFIINRRPDLIPPVSEEEIQDKSKADMFAKSIITLQASFFVIQCLYRLITHLPISLLELNTFAHTLCALLTFAFWWKKPLEVGEPTVIVPRGESQELWAALCFNSEIHKGYIRDSQYLTPVDLPAPSRDSNAGLHPEVFAESSLHHGRHIGRLRCFREPESFGIKNMDGWPCTPQDRLRWTLVGWYRGEHSFRELHPDTLCDRVVNWPRSFDWDTLLSSVDRKESGQLLVAFTLAGLSYGALHLLAWNFRFNSHAEHLLWQISAITIAASGPALLIVKLLKSLWDHIYNDYFSDVFQWLILIFTAAYFLLYMFSRVYVIVESFISFAYLPDAAFQQPQWTYYFPHIG